MERIGPRGSSLLQEARLRRIRRVTDGRWSLAQWTAYALSIAAAVALGTAIGITAILVTLDLAGRH